MRLDARHLAILVGVAGFTLGIGPAAAQQFPSKPIALIIPFGPGGASDLTARTFVAFASEVIGQPMVIHTKPGGGGAIATEFVAQSNPDGYTLLIGHTNCNSILPAIEGRSRGPDGLTPVARINTSADIYVAQAGAPFTTFKEMIAWAKANPGQLSVSTAGTWSGVGFTWKVIERDYGIRLRIVSYTGGAEALVALLGGHVMVSLLAPPQTLPHIKAGTLRALAYAGDHRHRELPDTPTAAEQGFDKSLTVFKGIMVPKGTPPPVVDKLARAFKTLLGKPEVREAIHKLGDEIHYQGPEEFAEYWRAEFETYRKLGQVFKP